MDLQSGYPFWPIRNGLMHVFPPLEADLVCEMAIVGGGITAALIARELCAHGIEVAVLERRDFGWGSTFAETADGLPFFGPPPNCGPRQLFAMAYGGNGIVYSRPAPPCCARGSNGAGIRSRRCSVSRVWIEVRRS